jgi:hypothetical protein
VPLGHSGTLCPLGNAPELRNTPEAGGASGDVSGVAAPEQALATEAGCDLPEARVRAPRFVRQEKVVVAPCNGVRAVRGAASAVSTIWVETQIAGSTRPLMTSGR